MLMESLFQSKVKCRYCNEIEQVKRHGKSRAGLPRYFCKLCNRTFQARYIYKGSEHKIA